MAATRTPTPDGALGAGPGESDPGRLLLDSLTEPDQLGVSREPGSHQGDATRVLLAVSGGADSTALMLVAAAVLPAARLVVGHVHHGMQAEADDWLAQVRHQAAMLGLHFCQRRLDGWAAAQRRHDGLGPEAWARRERYRALAEMAGEAGASVIVVAHHRDDQIETHLLQAARGAGDRGRAAMAAARWLDGPLPLRLLRPFLSLPREQLLAVVARAGWQPVQDPSNVDPARRRSRLRLERTAACESGGLTGQDGGNADAALLARIERHRHDDDRAREQAFRDLERVALFMNEDPPPTPVESEWKFTQGMATAQAGSPSFAPAATTAGSPVPVGSMLSRSRLAALEPARRAALWRLWLSAAGLGLPSRRRLEEIDRQMVANAAAEGRVRHDGWLVIRYRDRIGLIDVLPGPLEPGQTLSSELRGTAPANDDWLIALPVDLPDIVEIGPGRADERWRPARPVVGTDTTAHVAIPGGGPAAGTGSHALRKLWQEADIPPWLRPALPVLRDPADGRVLAAAPFGRLMTVADAPEPVWHWQPAPMWRRWLRGAGRLATAKAGRLTSSI